jgi:hypothetical protein
MLRVVLTVVVPLLLPTALWLGWVAATRRAEAGAAAWAVAPWPWLLAGGVALAAATLYVVNVGFGEEEGGRYVPPTVVDGQLVPGHFER